MQEASSASSPAAAALAPSRGGGPNEYSARQPSCCTCHGEAVGGDRLRHPVGEAARPAGSPTAKSSARGASSSSAARIAATDSGVAGERAADAADVDRRVVEASPTAAATSRRQAVGGGRHAAADRLADHEQVGVEAVGARCTRRDRRRSCGSRRARAACRSSRVRRRSASWKPGSGSTMPTLVMRRLGEDARDVVAGERGGERVDVVERHDGGRRAPDRPARRANRRGRRRGPSASSDDERLVDRAVVAPVEHEDPRPAGGAPGDAQREAVGIRRAQRKLPRRQAEPPGELGGDRRRVLRREHRRRAPVRPVGDRRGHGRHGVAGHGARCRRGRDRCSRCRRRRGRGRRDGLGDEQREVAGPAPHPGHRHAGQEVRRTGGRQLGRPWVGGAEVGRSRSCSSASRARSRRGVNEARRRDDDGFLELGDDLGRRRRRRQGAGSGAAARARPGRTGRRRRARPARRRRRGTTGPASARTAAARRRRRRRGPCDTSPTCPR